MYDNNYYPYDQASTTGATEIFLIIWLISAILGLIMFISIWKIFKKANKPGWTAIVPFYNIMVLLEIVNMPTWYIVLFFIPGINVVVSLLASFRLAKLFNKSNGFGIGLVFLPFIFYPVLAFGKSEYIGMQEQNDNSVNSNKEELKEEVNNNPNNVIDPAVLQNSRFANNVNNKQTNEQVNENIGEPTPYSAQKLNQQPFSSVDSPANEDLVQPLVDEPANSISTVEQPVGTPVQDNPAQMSVEKLLNPESTIEQPIENNIPNPLEGAPTMESPVEEKVEEPVNIEPNIELPIENNIPNPLEGAPIVEQSVDIPVEEPMNEEVSVDNVMPSPTESMNQPVETNNNEPEYRECPNCKSKVRAGSDTCFLCGTKL